MERQTDRQTDRQIDRHTNEQTNRKSRNEKRGNIRENQNSGSARTWIPVKVSFSGQLSCGGDVRVYTKNVVIRGYIRLFLGRFGTPVAAVITSIFAEAIANATASKNNIFRVNCLCLSE